MSRHHTSRSRSLVLTRDAALPRLALHALLAAGLFLLLLAALPATARAGLVVNEHGALGEFRTNYIQYGKWMTATDHSISIFDPAANQMTFINARSKIYWQGTPDEFRSMSFGEAAVEQQVSGLPKEQRAAMRKKLMDSLKRMEAETRDHQFTVRKTDETAVIADQPTVRYEIHKDGKKVEDFWLAKGLGGKEHFDYKGMMAMWRAMLPPGVQMPQHSKDVMEIMSQGLVLKTVEYDAKGQMTDLWEATGIQEVDIPASSFAIPDGFQPADLFSVLN